jgi:hypothetical protein
MGVTKKVLMFAAAVLLAMSGISARAAEHKLPESFLIGDENGISVDEAGDYAIYITDLNPGDVITRTVTIRNLEKSGSYALSMTAEPMDTAGPLNLLDNMLLRVKLEGRLLYEGRLRGDGAGTKNLAGNGADMIENALPLGSYASGDYGKLELEIVADFAQAGYWTLAEKSAAEVRWRFDAVKEAGSGTPKTGEAVRIGLYILLALLLTAAAVTWYRWRKLKARAACETRQAAGGN